MYPSRKTLISFVFSVTALVLSGCGGGGSGNAAPPVPGNCAAGQVYSTQYGCLAQGNCPYGQGMTAQGQCVSTTGTTLSSCQQTNQGPMVYTQFGCLPQGNCPAGQGAYVANGVQSCIQAQMGMGMGMMGAGQSCPMGPNGYPMVMTSKGCLPQNLYVCAAGQGFLTGRCYSASANVSVGVNVNTTSVAVDDYSDIDLEAEFAKMDREEMSDLYTDGVNCYVDAKCVKKIKHKANKLKIKYYRHCR